MSKILVVGAGGQGGPCASILARDEQVELSIYNICGQRVKTIVNETRQAGDF